MYMLVLVVAPSQCQHWDKKVPVQTQGEFHPMSVLGKKIAPSAGTGSCEISGAGTGRPLMSLGTHSSSLSWSELEPVTNCSSVLLWGKTCPVSVLGLFFVPVSALGRCHNGG